MAFVYCFNFKGMGHTTGWQQWGLPTSFVFYHVQEHAILFTSGEVKAAMLFQQRNSIQFLEKQSQL